MTKESSRSPTPENSPVSHENEESAASPPKGENGEEERGQWGNKVEFILSTLGMSVGIGNIWRYSGLAYENGGSAFLIPYITCSLLFAFPIVYAEFTMGQYSRVGPAKALRNYAPAFQGVGWAMWLIAIPVAIYYAIVVAWSMIYLGFVIVGKSGQWNTCDNSWNTDRCVPITDHVACKQANDSFPFAFNGTCWSREDYKDMKDNLTGGAEEFFNNFVTTRSTGIADFVGMNWPMFGCICGLYVAVALVLCKGMKYLGKVSYVTVPLPYIVLVIFLIRGLTLEGAMTGVKFYLLEPDFGKLLHYKTWSAALAQVCFSIGLGYGNLMSMSSYSDKHNNCFRDALIIVIGDSLMSIVGGVAAFSILGYVSFQTGKEITEIVQSGPALAFVAYPEAVTTLPLPYIWAFLFFLMLFLLGFSSQIAYVDMVITFCYDLFPKLKKYSWVMAILFSTLIAGCSCFMATEAQWYWFNLMSEFSATVAPCVVSGIEVAILIYVYGWKNVVADMEEMHGEAPRKWYFRIFSRFSPFFRFSWAFFCPLLSIALAAASMYRAIPYNLDGYVFPIWAEVIGWVLNLGPLVPIPVFFVVNCIRNAVAGNKFRVLFRPRPEHPAYKRMFPEAVGERELEEEEEKENGSEKSKREEESKKEEKSAEKSVEKSSKQKKSARNEKSSRREKSVRKEKSDREGTSARKEKSTRKEESTRKEKSEEKSKMSSKSTNSV